MGARSPVDPPRRSERRGGARHGGAPAIETGGRSHGRRGLPAVLGRRAAPALRAGPRADGARGRGGAAAARRALGHRPGPLPVRLPADAADLDAVRPGRAVDPVPALPQPRPQRPRARLRGGRALLLAVGAGRGVVGLATSIPHGQFEELRRLLPAAGFKDLGRRLDQIRWIRSEEELGWLRRSAELTDRACELLEARIRPGLSEHDLVTTIHEAFLPEGGQAGLHFLAATSMADPDRFVPWQFPTGRVLRQGDVVITEITVSWWGYGAQIHRPFAVAAEVIAERGFTVFDSVVHGEGGRNPELGISGSAHTLEPWTFQENQVMVVQPNPVTLDHRAGLQLGCAVRVAAGGAEPLHRYPFEFPVCG